MWYGKTFRYLSSARITKISVPVLGGRKKHGNFPKSILKL